MTTLLGMFVKHPVAGQVKTRLAKHLGSKRAAELYAAFVTDLSTRFRDCSDHRVLCYTPSSNAAADYFAKLAADDYELWPQPEGSLGDRMNAFFRHFGASDSSAESTYDERDAERFTTDLSRRIVLIGSDSPTLPREIVDNAFALLNECDCVLGPATDGGYYLIGQQGRAWPLFDNIDWSSPRVLEQTVARISDLDARLQLTFPWYDVDTPTDLHLLRGHLHAMRLSGHAIELEQTARQLDAVT